VNTQA
jgi:hypothetical protein